MVKNQNPWHIFIFTCSLNSGSTEAHFTVVFFRLSAPFSGLITLLTKFLKLWKCFKIVIKLENYDVKLSIVVRNLKTILTCETEICKILLGILESFCRNYLKGLLTLWRKDPLCPWKVLRQRFHGIGQFRPTEKFINKIKTKYTSISSFLVSVVSLCTATKEN